MPFLFNEYCPFEDTTKYLTFIYIAQISNYQHVTEKLQIKQKKNDKNSIAYRKNTYLCIVLINK